MAAREASDHRFGGPSADRHGQASAGRAPTRRAASPFADVLAALGAFRIWHLLALQDVRQRYRRSVIGPFWNTLSLAVSVGALSLVFTKIFNQPVEQYLTFLSTGIVFWTLIASLLTESCSAFIQAEGIIKQVNLPLGVHVMRMVWRNLIHFAHHLPPLALLLLYMGVEPGVEALLVVPALALATITAVALGYLLGGLCARFRDISPIVASLVQVAFYVTPVLWQPALLKGHEHLMTYNPLHHFLEILRAPVLGGPVTGESWASAFGITVAVVVVALLFLARYRKRISYWL